MPTQRYAHAAWAYRSRLYIFGGISLFRYPQENSQEIVRYLRAVSDLWCYDTEKKTWREVEAAGSSPCARAFMGAHPAACMRGHRLQLQAALAWG